MIKETETSDTEWQRESETSGTRRDRAVEANAHNREVLFAALAAAGIRTVIAHFVRMIANFDDYSHLDDLQFDCSAYAGAQGEGTVQIPTTLLTIQAIKKGWWPELRDNAQTERISQTERLEDAIETVCIQYLKQIPYYDGEIGYFGTFKFDTAKKTIELDYNECIGETENYEHEF